MTTKNTKAIVNQPSEEVSQQLAQGFPAEQGFVRINFPRLDFKATDKTEGKGKAMRVIREAGTFIRDYQSEEIGEDGKKIWNHDEIGPEIEGTIVFQRRQLKYYNQDTEEFTSSTIFDSAEDVIPLFLNSAEIVRGTTAELKAKYEYEDPKDKDYNIANPDRKKMRSKLEDNKVLYVLYAGEIHQLTLRGSSMYSCKTYLKENPNPTILLTKFSSEPKEKGSIAWNQMTFETVRKLSAEEAEVILEKQNEIRQAVADEKAYFAQMNPQTESLKDTADEVNKFLKEKN